MFTWKIYPDWRGIAKISARSEIKKNQFVLLFCHQIRLDLHRPEMGLDDINKTNDKTDTDNGNMLSTFKVLIFPVLLYVLHVM